MKPMQKKTRETKSIFFIRLVGTTFALALSLQACGGGGSSNSPSTETPPVTEAWKWNLPNGFAAPAVPQDNPMNTAKVELGRALFYDARLSGNGTQSCASCHSQASAFTDNRALSVGSTGKTHPRNAQPLANVAYHTTLTWANPNERSLEHQMLTPIFGSDPVEMGVNDSNRADVLARFKGDSSYLPRFKAAFAGEADPLNWDNIVKAIAAFERTMISADSRYDRFTVGKETLSQSETRGMQLFFGDKAKCASCHGSANFNDQFTSASSSSGEPVFHNTGLFNIGGTGAYPEPNRGVFEITQLVQDMGKFRTASLRNIELTAPYMHDGSIGTLEAVLDFYAAGGRNVGNGLYAGDGRLNPFKDPLIAQIRIDDQDKTDLVAFLKALTDHSFVNNSALADPAFNR